MRKSNVFDTIDSALMSALGALSPPQRPTQEQLYRSVNSDPRTLLSFVREKTGLDGDALVTEAVKYQREMENRYGK